jgi:predicted nucleic acid-binding protein
MVQIGMEEIAISKFKATCLSVLEQVRKTKKPILVTADRLLAATAKVYGLTLVIADENLIRGKGYSVLANQT